MDQQIEKSLRACVAQYGNSVGKSHEALTDALIAVFQAQEPFMEKVAKLDTAFDDAPAFEALRELVFDLLMMNFFAADVVKLEADYLDSPEWESIEERTLDRGTELLNLLLYLRECADEKIEPELNDYLQEFLLVEEDEFQDEYQIYESVIAQPILSESSYLEIGKAAKKLDDNDPLLELFYPMLSFFYEMSPNEKDFEEFTQHALEPAFDTAVYRLLVNYNR